MKCKWSESCSVVSNFLRPFRLYSPWNSPAQNTGVGSHSLLQGIFPTQGLNPGLLHCRQILYQLSHQGNPSLGILLSMWNPISLSLDIPSAESHCSFTPTVTVPVQQSCIKVIWRHCSISESWAPRTEISDAAALGWGLRVCVSNKLPGNVAANPVLSNPAATSLQWLFKIKINQN